MASGEECTPPRLSFVLKSYVYVSDVDTCKLGNELVIEKQSIGVAKRTQGFDDGIDGILGYDHSMLPQT